MNRANIGWNNDNAASTKLVVIYTGMEREKQSSLEATFTSSNFYPGRF